MEANKVYKHINGRDAAIKIIRILYDSEGNAYCRVVWINIVNRFRIYYLDVEDIKIKKEDLSKWQLLK